MYMSRTIQINMVMLTFLLFTNQAAAQSTCAVPVEYYLTDISGEPLNTSIDVELNFYLSDDADALAVDCRIAREVPVSRGWMRLMLDACSLPPDDGSGCGTSTLQDLFIAGDATGDTVHVGIRIADDTGELTPRTAIGAVPFAVRAGQAAHAETAGDAATVGGIAPDEFLRVGDLDCLDGEGPVYTTASGWTCATAASSGPAPGMGSIMYGNYYIYNSADLASLAGFTEVTGDLLISVGDMPNLNGLENLTSVGDNLLITSNNALTNLEGLNKLESVGGSIEITSNDALTNLEGLNNLESVGDYLSIVHNDALSSLGALNNLTSIPGSLIIDNNETLTSLEGLNNLTSVGNNLEIKENVSLTSINNMSVLTHIEGNAYVQDNISLCESHVAAFFAAVTFGGSLGDYSSNADC
jgi:hypothetical protein